jgi:RNA polymerase sigma factor (sigma-70 family)
LRDLEVVLSLDQHVGAEDGDATLGDLLASSQPSVEDIVEGHFQSRHINMWLEQLSSRHRRVIELRFGLRDDRPSTLEEVGQEMGVTRERVRQIEVKALERLNDIAMTSRW